MQSKKLRKIKKFQKKYRVVGAKVDLKQYILK